MEGQDINKQKTTLFIVLFCSLLFFVTNAKAESSEIVQTKSIENKNIQYIGEQEIPEYLPVFETVPLQLSSGLVSEVASDLFGMTNDSLTSKGDYYVFEGNKTLEMDAASGSIFFADYSKLWDVSYRADLLDLASCEAITADLLATKQNLFYNHIFKGFGSTNATGINTETQETTSKVLNIHVNYGFELAGFPLKGPGGTSTVTLGNQGEIIGMSWVYRNNTAILESKVDTFADVLERNGISDYIGINYELVYYAEPRGEVQNYLYPMYEFEVTQIINDQEIVYYKHLPATNFHPDCFIIEPTNLAEFDYNKSVTFDCNIVGGTGPFTYYWESDIDGFLSNAKTFSTNDLSTGLKNDTLAGHIITLTVTDDNGLTCQKSVEVIIRKRTTGIGSELIVGILTIASVLTFFFLRKKSNKKKTMLYLAMISILMLTMPISQISFAAATVEPKQRFLIIQDTGDDGTREIGCEYVVYSGDDYLPNSDNRAKDLYNYVDNAAGWTKKFIWGGNNAWEQDFKYQSAPGGGTDYAWIDSVDLGYYTGHGNPSGITFTSSHDDGWLDHSHASWGDQDLEWIVLDSCSVLNKETDSGETIFDRWGPALDGVHQILGFHTGAFDRKNRGAKFGFNLQEWDFGFFKINAMRVKDAWFKACKDTENSDVWCAVLYATQSQDPWSPQTNDPIHDYLWGQGYVSSDPTPAKWWVWLASSC